MCLVSNLLSNMNINKGYVIGSQSLYKLNLSKSDIDIVIDFNSNTHINFNNEYNKTIIQNGIKVELLNSNTNFLNFLLNSTNNKVSFANPIENYIIKMGHIHRSINWYKHMNDINYIKRNSIISEYYKGFKVSDLIKDQRSSTDMRLGKQVLPKLNVSKNEFFDDGVIKFIDHDLIHELVAHNDVPVYKMMQHKNNEVFCSKQLWDKLSFEKQIQAVLEECYVIACERLIIPQFIKGSNDYYTRYAFMWALMRVSTDLTSGFFREFAINNNETIVNSFNNRYYVPVLNYIKNNNLY